MSDGGAVVEAQTAAAPPLSKPEILKDRLELLDRCKLKGKITAEIGVLCGKFSEEILARQPCEHYMIDSWAEQADYHDVNAHDQKKFEALYHCVREDFAFPNVHVHRMFSHEAVREIDRKFDFIYIDANHAQSYVMFDLCAWYTKVKDGGILAGHDYGGGGGRGHGFVGVRMAVDAFCKVTGNTLEYLTSESWGSFAIRIKRTDR